MSGNTPGGETAPGNETTPDGQKDEKPRGRAEDDRIPVWEHRPDLGSSPRFASASRRLEKLFTPRRLAVLLLVNSAAAGYLAFRDAQLGNDPLEKVFIATLLAISLTNLFACFSLAGGLRSWLLLTIVAQTLFFLLAIYVFLTAAQTPGLPWRAWIVMLVSGPLGLFAMAWVLYAIHYGQFKGVQDWTKTLTPIVALVPLGAVIGFWVQSDYLPKVTDPLVDVSPELTPVGRFTPVGKPEQIRLSAKVTFHNRGAAKVYVAAALMRVTTYPYPAGPDPAATPDYVERQFDMGSNADSVFRATPTLPAEAQLAYVEDLAGAPGKYLNPGDTLPSQRELDICANNVRLARLTVTAVFFTDRKIRNISWVHDDNTDSISAIEYDIAQRTPIQDFIAGDWHLAVKFYKSQASDERLKQHRGRPLNYEYPQIDYKLCSRLCPYTPDTKPPPPNYNPLTWTEERAEYAPTNHETNQK